MKTVSIHASHPYEVYIGPHLLADLGRCAHRLGPFSTAAIVSDSAVWPLYGKAAADSLHAGGIATVSFVFPAGEASKNGETYLHLLEFLAENRLTRSDLIVALGGGVVGDLAGFAAATYLRGIAFLQIPTTLLAAVDASVGGKTAIDLPAGKNLAGAFYQPRLVLCDTHTLETLPPELFREGCAEVIKYGVLYDPDLFSHLLARGLDFDREEVIARCVAWKGQVVAEDEFDCGQRQKLNLGHTIGHTVEAASGFAIRHGAAVAIGMAMIARAGCGLGITAPEARDRILEILTAFGLPVSTPYPPETLLSAALSDKKRFGSTVNLIIPRQIGDCIIRPTPISELPDLFQAGEP